jgi:tetratricopeptide (TPR) repeat protein
MLWMLRGFMVLGCAGVLSAQAPMTPRELIEGDHWKRARAWVDAHPGSDAETLYLMATIKQAFGDLDGAEKYAQRAVDANPKEAEYHYRLSEITGAKAQKASVFHQIGLGRTFKKECDATLSINPNHVGALFNSMEFYLHAPGVIGGDKAKAHALAEKISKLDAQKGIQAEIEIANAEKQQSKVEDIIRNAVATFKPANFDGHLMLANWMVNQKEPNYPEAMEHAQQAMHAHPDRVGSYSVIAGIYARQQKWAELDAILAQADKASPDNYYAYFRSANTLLNTKSDLPRAERYFRKYLTQDPEAHFPSASAAHWRLGLVLDAAGRKQEAMAEWKTAVKLDPNSPAKKELK